MATFTYDELNMICSRGFPGSPNPLVPTFADRVVPPGSTTHYTYVPYNTPNVLYDFGTWYNLISSFVCGPTLVYKSEVTPEGGYFDGWNEIWIEVTAHYTGQARTGADITVSFAKDGVIQTVQQETATTDNGVYAFVGVPSSSHAYLTCFWNTLNSEFDFGIDTQYVLYNSDWDVVEIVYEHRIQKLTRQSIYEINQPYYDWYHQNKTDWFNQDTQVPPMGQGGGGGGFARQSDTIGFSGLPGLDILNFGCISQYRLSEAQMQSFSQYLWSSNFIDNILKNWQDPLQNIISLAFVPLGAELVGTNDDIKIGNLTAPVQGLKLSKSIYEKDFGTVNFNEVYGNFADFSPYTKLQIYLPTAGIKELNPDNYMDGKMHLKAYIDVFSGTVVYQLMSIRHGKTFVVDHYQGSCLTQIPITGQNFIQAYQAVVNGIASTGSGNITGMLSSFSNIKPSYEKAGSITGSANRLSVHTPYIFFDTPQLRMPDNYRSLHGYVSNQYVELGTCVGYAQVKYMDMKNIKLTDTEKDELKNILETGVYINVPPTTP